MSFKTTLKLFYAAVFKVGRLAICVLRSFPSRILKKTFLTRESKMTK